jgi:glycosyltransferase involved in cell wall biosynthesis
VLDALAGTGLEVGRILSKKGIPWICNRGSTHILEQKKLLDYEHDCWNVPRINFSQVGIERCLQEYDEATAIVVPSRFNRRSFLSQGVCPEKIYVRPYGVNLEMFHPMPKEDKVFRVLFVGSASLRKGIGYLFEAIRPLVARRMVECWLVGAISDEVRHLLEENAGLFTYHGPQRRADLSWFYSQASVLVLPSIEEGLALVQAQAMACGVPVIATTNTGAEELFIDEREGFIVPIRDPEAIRNKINYFLDSPDALQEMKARVLVRVKNLGGWNEYGESCLQLYTALKK